MGLNKFIDKKIDEAIDFMREFLKQKDRRIYHRIILVDNTELIILCDNVYVDFGNLYAVNYVNGGRRDVRVFASKTWKSYSELPNGIYQNVIS